MIVIIEVIMLIGLAAILLNLERLTANIRPAKTYIKEIRHRLNKILADKK